MKRIHAIFAVLLSLAASSAIASAQAPTVTIDPQSHGNLAAAQQSIVNAYARISDAQQANDDRLGGHAGKAKDLLTQANQELQLAANVANNNSSQGGPAGPPSGGAPKATAPSTQGPSVPNLSGNWTIYAYNTNKPGSSLKQIQLSQNGNIISGEFHGPNQHGKLQGFVQGNHVEFSTDTHEVLTFRGQITATGMSGLYGIEGQHAPWTAERTN